MKISGTGQWLRGSLLTVTLLVTSALTGQFVLAQTAAGNAPAKSAVSEATPVGLSTDLTEIVVTGTYTPQPIMDTSYAVTVVDQEALLSSRLLRRGQRWRIQPQYFCSRRAGRIFAVPQRPGRRVTDSL
jgi:hypothetical protein